MRSDNQRQFHETPWTCSVPQWEKQFCSTVGSIPWRRFLEMKRYIHLYDNVVNWDDSAGEQAFNDAKTRFWAKIKGLPCDDAPLPNPDAYIDYVDWDSAAADDDDPELVLDLETGPENPPEQARDENSVALTEALLMSRVPFSCSGWGETEESFERAKESRKPPGINVPWGRSYDCKLNNPNLDAYWGANARKNNNATGWYDSRYKASRFPTNYECHANRAYRDRRKAANFAHEKHALRQWAMKS